MSSLITIKMELRYKACDKKSYQSKKEATRAAKTLQSSPDISLRSLLRAYKCEQCESWHLTHHTDVSSKVFFREQK